MVAPLMRVISFWALWLRVCVLPLRSVATSGYRRALPRAGFCSLSQGTLIQGTRRRVILTTLFDFSLLLVGVEMPKNHCVIRTGGFGLSQKNEGQKCHCHAQARPTRCSGLHKAYEPHRPRL